MNRHSSKLAELQEWLLAAIVNPETPAAVDVEQQVAASQALTAGERLEVYRHAYVARLLDVLREWFPCATVCGGGRLV